MKNRKRPDEIVLIGFIIIVMFIVLSVQADEMTHKFKNQKLSSYLPWIIFDHFALKSHSSCKVIGAAIHFYTIIGTCHKYPSQVDLYVVLISIKAQDSLFPLH